tara:strand:+ start:150 stop:404 length:255 start_codon:yes stop_codon:yes gene_type:complete
MDEQIQEQENFYDTSLVKEAALVEAKKKTVEAKSHLHRFISAGKKQIKKNLDLDPESLSDKITSGIVNKVKSGLKNSGPSRKKR